MYSQRDISASTNYSSYLEDNIWVNGIQYYTYFCIDTGEHGTVMQEQDESYTALYLNKESCLSRARALRTSINKGIFHCWIDGEWLEISSHHKTYADALNVLSDFLRNPFTLVRKDRNYIQNRFVIPRPFKSLERRN